MRLLFVHRPVRAVVAVVGGELGSSLYRLLGREDKADGGSLRWRISLRAVRRPGGRWRLWERSVAPRLSMCQMASARRRARSTCATLAPRCLPIRAFVLLVAVAVDGMGAGVRGCFDERPAEIARALLAEWAA